MKIDRLQMDQENQEVRLAVLKAVSQRCSDLKANLALIVVPSDEASILKMMGFINPCKATEWVTDRHKDEIKENEVVLVFKPPNYSKDNYGPIPEKK